MYAIYAPHAARVPKSSRSSLDLRDQKLLQSTIATAANHTLTLAPVMAGNHMRVLAEQIYNEQNTVSPPSDQRLTKTR